MTQGGRVSLNIDLGELEEEPEELYALASVANIACGAHAGDEKTIHRAISLAEARGTAVAAHPSYPDREGFGRRARFAGGEVLLKSLEAQLELFAATARECGARVVAMKPHGALYHDANADPALAAMLVDVTVRVLGNVAIVGPPGGELQHAAEARGLVLTREGFADRRYGRDGRIVARSEPGAVLGDPSASASQALELARGQRFDTLCVHGDSPSAVGVARAVREALSREGLLLEHGS